MRIGLGLGIAMQKMPPSFAAWSVTAGNGTITVAADPGNPSTPTIVSTGDGTITLTN